MIAARTAVVIVVETAVAIAVVDVVAAGAVVVPVEEEAVVDIITARADETCLPQNMHRRRVTAIRAATIIVTPTIVSPALPWTRSKTISFSRANRSPNIAAVPFLLP